MRRSRAVVAALPLMLALAPSSLARAESQLRPLSELITNCLDFPANNFDRQTSVKGTYGHSPHLMRSLGDPAVDFTLHDADGQPWNLRENLEKGKPVVLIWGMWSCPAYQGLDSQGSDSRWTYWDENELVESRGDKATFVHMYGPEPHPTLPDTNFDAGRPLPNAWSTMRQHMTYGPRRQAARDIRKITHPDIVILPDYLPGNPYSDLIQPAWCSYALGARAAIIISEDGRIFFQQEWLNTDDVAAAIDGYWSQGGEGTWQSSDEKAGTKIKPRDGQTSRVNLITDPSGLDTPQGPHN